MQVISFKTGPVSANTYIVYNPAVMEGVVIDPGGGYKRIKQEAAQAGIALKAQLLTHGHFDHCGASAMLQKDGIPAYIHEKDFDKPMGSGCLAESFGIPFDHFTPDCKVRDGEVLHIASLEIKVLHTPGHTSGSVCYIIEDAIFSGDTLFNMSVGRTDFPEGDFKALNKSIRDKLFALEGDYALYPGHDEFSTLSYERKYNPMVEWE
jgi:hydroxyacylglutathione hydrolase